MNDDGHIKNMRFAMNFFTWCHNSIIMLLYFIENEKKLFICIKPTNSIVNYLFNSKEIFVEMKKKMSKTAHFISHKNTSLFSFYASHIFISQSINYM